MPNALRSAAIASIAALALAACGGEAPLPAPPPPPPPAPTVVATVAPEPPPAPPVAKTQEEAHRLVVLAASCWLGGLWSDALGQQDAEKTAGSENRCHDLERHVWGADDKTHFEQLRAIEQNAAADVAAKVDETAKTDGVDASRRDALVKLVDTLAAASKETMDARRAGARVKRDLAGEPDKLSKDEVDAVPPLRAHAKLDALLRLDVGDLTREANALGILLALDRVEIGRGLPKHLKIYALGDTLSLLFGTPVPVVPDDATTKLRPGTWLKFLLAVATSAGHPVGDKVKGPRQRDALAWAGMLEGFHDKLKADSDGVATTTDLGKVTTVALHRLEAEFQAQNAAEATKLAPRPKK